MKKDKKILSINSVNLLSSLLHLKPKELKIIALYSIISLIIWYVTPRTGGGRFILPYLTAFSILIVGFIEALKSTQLKFVLVLIITSIAISSIVYRGIAVSKYLPVILGKESKDVFLSRNLNFSFGDFYDTDDYFKSTINEKDKVLIYGGHNLFYVNFPFIHESFVKKGDTFNYLITINENLPKRFWYWNLIYENKQTGVKLYTLGGQEWVY